MAWIDALFQRMVQTGASDLHMTSTLVPMFRLHGDIVPVEGCPVITPEQMTQILLEITPEHNRREFDTRTTRTSRTSSRASDASARTCSAITAVRAACSASSRRRS